MKKWFSFLLALAMVFAMGACAGAQEDAPVLQVGFGKVNITPKTQEPLAGYSDNERRKSEGVEMDVFATCIAVTSGEETILIFTVDTLNADHKDAEEYRKAITEKTGIPGEKIFIGATHGHNCPADSGNYRYQMKTLMAEAAEAALADRSVATLQAAKPTIEGMNFVRHYKMSDGSYAGSNFGSFSSGEILDHAAEADDQAVLVKFDRSDDKKDILMVNWQAHPDNSKEIGYYLIAPSWVGPLRDTLEEETGMLVAYFTGASGNLNPNSKIVSEQHGLKWKEYGEKMGMLLAAQTDKLENIDGTTIRTTRVMQQVEVDHSWDHMLGEANMVYVQWKAAGLEAGNLMARDYGFTSVYQARAIRTRFEKPATEELEINAFSIGGIGFTAGTYEMFTESGQYIKENSPFAVTFHIAGNSGYIPSAAAYDYRSYEADTGHYAKGTAETLAEKYVQMLKDIS